MFVEQINKGAVGLVWELCQGAPHRGGDRVTVFQAEEEGNGAPERSTCKSREAQQGMACWGSKDCQVAAAGVMVVRQ